MELSAATPTLNATDVFSLLPLLGNNPAASTASSVSPALNFSALLTEMTGTNPNPTTVAPPLANQTQIAPVAQTQPAQDPQQIQPAPTDPRVGPLPVQPADPKAQTAAPQTQTAQTMQLPPAQPQAVPPAQTAGDVNPVPQSGQSAAPAPAPLPTDNSNTQPKAKGTQKTQDSAKDAQKTPAAPNTTPGVNVLVASMACVSSAVSSSAQVSAASSTPVDDKKIKADDASAQAIAEAMHQIPQPELERAFADVKKFEFTVEPDTTPSAAANQQNDATGSLSDALKAAVVATDPIVTVQQQQLSVRIIGVQPVASDAKASERSKSNSTSASATTVSTGTSQPADLVRPVEAADQVLAANPIEIPNMPHLPAVRTVAMEVGDPGSQVTIRIQERGGDVAMQLNTGSTPLHQDLQSSVGSLVQSLKQEQVQVSNIEVTRKSPIDKVRRMKEAQ